MVGGGKAATDTLYLLGGPNREDGKFQDIFNQPDAEGWTGVDLTVHEVHWQIDTFHATNLDPLHTPNHAMWCGATFDNASGAGYGNDWNDWLDWSGVVPNDAAPTTVTVLARLNYDTEENYDYVYLEVDRGGTLEVVHDSVTGQPAAWTGTGTGVNLNLTFVVEPADYVGTSGDEVHLRWRGRSDGGWSDQDGTIDTDGLCQLDNVEVLFNGSRQTFDDFEAGSEVNWTPTPQGVVGCFAKVWAGLADLDPCAENASPQFAFIDDGVVVPGTGGTYGVTWTYGPGGYVMNLTGGLAGPDCHLHNEIWSPVLDWPAGSYDGAVLAFDVYRHLPLDNGLAYVWHIRSSCDGGATWSSWLDFNFAYMGGTTEHLRQEQQVGHLVSPGCDKIQVALGVNEIGWEWGYVQTDGTPAPYFDNVSLAVYSLGGPTIVARDIDLAQDNFPAIGIVDYGSLGNNDVRFDMARNISPRADERNDPGDSIIVDIAARFGTTLVGTGEMVYNLRRNHLFDPYRYSGMPDQGSVPGELTYSATGSLVPDRYHFDLPDADFLFPGDILHYYFRATDSGGGISLLPADTTGFSLFPGMQGYLPEQYPGVFTVTALPTMFSATPGLQPAILLWNDAGSREVAQAWAGALWANFYVEGVDYDVYETNGAGSGVGNGLGGRATSAQLAHYTTILYSCGDQSRFTLSNGDYEQDPSRDIVVLDQWLRTYGGNFFCTGNGLANDLNTQQGGNSFLLNWLPVILEADDIRPLIDNQPSPLVKPVIGNGLGLTQEFRVYGGCPGANPIDAVTTTGNAQRIARFCDISGIPSYSYAAGVYNGVAEYNAEIVFFPYDLAFVVPREGEGFSSDRAILLQEVLVNFGHSPGLGMRRIDYALLESPPTLKVNAGASTASVYGQVFVSDVTALPGATPGMVAELGYGPDGVDPRENPVAWRWTAASFHADLGGGDEYVGTMVVQAVGQYDYCYRFSYMGGSWVYGDLRSSVNKYYPDYAGELTVMPVEFADATTGPLGDPFSGTGVAWGDCDGDGDQDLYLANGEGGCRLFRNDGGGVFADATSGPLAGTGSGRGVAWGDYDNDGDLDLYLANFGSANQLFRNDGGGTFVDAASGPLGDVGAGACIAWADYDNDGDLDLYLSNYGQANRLFRNDGGGVFVDATSGPLGDDGNGSAVVWGDYDGDGDLDLYLANHGQANKLFRNDGPPLWSFTDATTDPLGDAGLGLGAAWGDHDGDGDLDLILANEADLRLLRNDGGGAFVDATSGPLLGVGGIGVAWGDYDNDCDLDLYVSRYGPNQLFRNEGGGTFVDATSSPLGDNGSGEGVAWADYDGDGDLDLYLANYGQPNKLFQNGVGALNHWLQVQLVGTASNRCGIGARVTVVAGGMRQMREVSGGSGLFSQNSLVQQFGLGSMAVVDSLIVRWPSGIRQVVVPLPAINTLVTVVEPLPPAIDWCYLIWPPSTTIVAGGYTEPIYGHVHIAGVTNQPGPTPGLVAQIGYGPDGSDPTVDPDAWQWVATASNPDIGEDDVYWAHLTVATAGQYDYCFRCSYYGGPWVYGDLDGSETGYSPASAGALTVSYGLFTDATSGPLGDTGTSQGVAWGDYDGDGYQDLYLSNSGQANLLFHNEGDGTFVDATTGPLGDTANNAGTAWGDYDNDGDLDLLLANWSDGTGVDIFRNDGGGTFSDVLDETSWAGATGVAWGDFDNDGDLDFHSALENQPDRLFRNDGSDVFTNVATGAIADPEYGIGVSWGDYDNDGDLDVFLAKGWNGTSKLFRNDGDGAFADATSDPITGVDGMGPVWGDYDNDGDLDLYLSRWGQESKLFRNEGPPSYAFVDATNGPLIGAAWTRGAAWADYDNDGDLDLCRVNWWSRPVELFRNDGGGTFVDVTAGPLVGTADGSSVAWADYDNDGDLDFYTANHYGYANKLFRNNVGTLSHWLQVKLVGSASNRCGIGARVTVVAGGTRQMREVSGGSGLFSQNSLVQQFGLGSMAVVDSLIVSWPSGVRQVVDPAPAVNALIMVTELPRAIGWCNLQWPPTIAIAAGLQSELIYGQIWIDGMTNQPGVTTSLEAELGYGPDGTDPASSEAWIWQVAEFNLDVGNNDEFKCALTVTRPGRYDYCYRYSYYGGAWAYGDLDGSTNGYDPNQAGDIVVTTPPVGWCNLQWPPALTVAAGVPTDPIYGQAWIDGVTNLPGVAPDLVAEVGYGAEGSDPTVEPGAWHWSAASFNLDVGNNDEFVGTLPGAASGQYDYCYRYSHGGGPWIYGDLDGSLNGYSPSQAGDLRVVSSTEFSVVDAGLPGLYFSSTAWGDYDNDGDLDVVLTGTTTGDESGAIAHVYRNDWPLGFTQVPAGLTGVWYGSVAWGDYDNDADLDILLTGATGSAPDHAPITRLYRNDGAGVFVNVSTALPAVCSSSVAWGDYDNDGDPDILLCGNTGSALITQIYRNDGGGLFSLGVSDLPGVQWGAVAWADKDRDGDLDFVLTGDTGAGYITSIYRNDGDGAFTYRPYAIPGVCYSSVAWGDYNLDWYPDLVVTGDTGAGDVTCVYKWGYNYTLLPGVHGGSASWGDYDNDGWLDILVTGSTSTGPTTRVYRGNQDGSFADICADLPGVDWSSAAWGDYDNDNDLDFLLAGSTGSGYVTRIAANNAPVPNTQPSPPYFSWAELAGDQMTVNWRHGGDVQWPIGLTYNLRVGTTPGGSEICGPMADVASGYRRVVQAGNVRNGVGWNPTYYMSWKVNLPPAWQDIYWSIQSIDGAYAGSAFSAEQRLARNFTDIQAGLQGLRYGQAVWLDFDNDEDLDLFMGGGTRWLYLNDGAGGFVSAPTLYLQALPTAMAWGDYDNDEDLDVFIVGDDNSGNYAELYTNENGVFQPYSTDFYGEIRLSSPTMTWGDYDNDGDLDLFMAGYDLDNQTPLARVYRQEPYPEDPDYTCFMDVHAGLLGTFSGSADWGDFDGDGDLDLLISGNSGTEEYSVNVTRVYRNDGQDAFTDISAGLPGIGGGSCSWGDYDNDGDLDILLSGLSDSGMITRVYGNGGAETFTDIGAGMAAIGERAAWGDCDNDGDLDVAVSGRLYANTGTVPFVEIPTAMPRVIDGSVAWGDYDGDLDLDLLLTGFTGSIDIAQVCRNDCPVPNQVPSMPVDLQSQLPIWPDKGWATLTWSAASDAQTPSAGLSYNLRIGTTPGGEEVLTGMADAATGFRRLVTKGNVQTLTWKLEVPPLDATYYWSVQAVDPALAGGTFAPEQSFLVSVSGVDEQIHPTVFALNAGAPNPFNPMTTIHFEVPQTILVKLEIFDMAGRWVCTLLDEVRPAGRHEVVWNGTGGDGKSMASGVYFCRMQAGTYRETRPLTLVK